MTTWEQIFNKPDEPAIDEWAKMFHPPKVDNKAGQIFGLDERTCKAARVFYGPEHELVKRYCKPETKTKYKVVFT